MYFSEPKPTQFDLNFTLLGVPVRVSAWFWLGSAIFGYNTTGGDPKLLLLWELAVFLSILIHEMGHAMAIRRYGGLPWVTLVFMGGLASDATHRRTPQQQIVISAAGPVAELLLAVLVIALIRMSGYYFPVPFWPDGWPDISGIDRPHIQNLYLSYFVFVLVWISTVWAIINLAPVYPLDGGQIARAAFAIFDARDGLRKSLWLSVVAGVAMALYGFTHDQPFLGILFAALAFDCFQTLQSFTGRPGRWS